MSEDARATLIGFCPWCGNEIHEGQSGVWISEDALCCSEACIRNWTGAGGPQ